MRIHSLEIVAFIPLLLLLLFLLFFSLHYYFVSFFGIFPVYNDSVCWNFSFHSLLFVLFNYSSRGKLYFAESFVGNIYEGNHTRPTDDDDDGGMRLADSINVDMERAMNSSVKIDCFFIFRVCSMCVLLLLFSIEYFQIESSHTNGFVCYFIMYIFFFWLILNSSLNSDRYGSRVCDMVHLKIGNVSIVADFQPMCS